MCTSDTTSTPGAPWFQRPWLQMQSFSFLVSCTCFKLLFRAIHRLLEIRCKLTNNNDIKQVHFRAFEQKLPPPEGFKEAWNRELEGILGWGWGLGITVSW